MQAVRKGNTIIAELLIEKGADVNIKEKDGSNLLHYLIEKGRSGDTAMARLLIAKGVDVNARNNFGHTPLSMAIILGDTYLSDFLRRHGDQGNSDDVTENKTHKESIEIKDFEKSGIPKYSIKPSEMEGEEQKPIIKKKVTQDGMVFIKGGCFQMGDTFGDGNSYEKTVHEVCVDDFYLGEHEVTQREWKEIMGNNPSYFKNCGDDCPVEKVSWNDVQDFIRRLNNKTGQRYRLPTEAEWEFAAREGGRKTKWAGTSSMSELKSYAWYTSSSGEKTHPVKTKQPNSLGLYDMSGNVMEWVSDWYGKDYYRNSPRNNPKGPSSGFYRVFRGGSWYNRSLYVRVATRLNDTPDKRIDKYGFRIAQNPVK